MQVALAQYEKIYAHPILQEVIDNLTYNRFFSGNEIGQITINVEFEKVKKGIWLCSILATSAEDKHRKKAQLFAALVYLHYKNNFAIEQACYVIFSRVGNLVATRLFDNFSTLAEDGFDAVLNLELAKEWNQKTITLSETDKVIASRFQKELWDDLNSKQQISISAPTSAGKSFVIKKYLKKCFLEKELFSALYIVPSRALLNQVSEEFRNEIGIDNVDIKTAFVDQIFDSKKSKQIYVLTPERCLRLIQQAIKQGIIIDFIFVDEIQNVEDEDGRGSLLEYVLKELSSLFPQSQIVIAGPNIEDSSSLFNRIFGNPSHPVETTVSPVFQIKTVIRPDTDNNIRISIKSVVGREQTFTLQTTFNLKNKINKSYADGIPYLIDFFAKGDQNIIYSPRTDYVEDWAISFVANTEQVSPLVERETSELIEYLEEEIHPKYYLIECLKRKAAFHHSKLPDIVRKEIEDGFLDGRIKNLFCTSTLLEGVNLPANNLFIVSPKKLNDELTPFEFGNLIGRAGRIKDSLYGTIYCIERENNTSWAEEYYDKTHQKEVLSVTEKALIDFSAFANCIDKPIDEISEPKMLNSVIFLRHKFLKNKTELIDYLTRKKLSDSSIDTLVDKISNSLANLTIPSDVSSINPSIDPIKQNELYLLIDKTGIENWAITPNSNFYNAIKKEDKDKFAFSETNLYWQLVSIMERLDPIFKIADEVFFKHQITLSIRQICYYGVRWLQNTSYKDAIDADIKFYTTHSNEQKRINAENADDINRRINEVIKINSTVVTYILVKYLKLLNDVTEPLMSPKQLEKYKFSLALPVMLELGTSEPIIIKLVSKGIARSIAIRIFDEFKKEVRADDVDVFEWLKTKKTLNLKPIYNRYLRKMKLLSID